MNQPLICMTLTGKTLDEDLKLVKKYEKYIDLVELRVDHLNEDEQLNARRFPAMIYQPCILTIRRDIDGGKFTAATLPAQIFLPVPLLLQILINQRTLLL